MTGRAAGAVFALALAGAVTLDALVPLEPAAPAGVAVPGTGGVLACPFASEGRGNAYLHLANVGTTPAKIRVTVLPARGRRPVIPLELRAGAVRSVRLHGLVKGKAGAIVEYTGGEVVASHTLWLPARGGPAGGGAATCARAGPAQTVITHVGTLRAETRLAVVNPGHADADITVTLLADGRALAPEGLAQRVVPARSRREFRLGDFAFDTRSLTAAVHSAIGRVVPEALVTSAAGVELIGAQTPSAELASIVVRTGPGATFSLSATGEDDAGIDSRLVTGGRQGKAPGIPPALAPGATRRVAVPDAGRGAPAAYALGVTVGSPVVAGASWPVVSGSSRDRAAAEAVPYARRWAGVAGIVHDRSSARAVVLNPGPDPAVARLRILGSPGGRSERSLTVAPGRVAVVVLGRGKGVFGFDLEAGRPVAVILEASAISTGRRIFGFALPATPLYPPVPVAVQDDPRTGVPAPRALL